MKPQIAPNSLVPASLSALALMLAAYGVTHGSLRQLASLMICAAGFLSASLWATASLMQSGNLSAWLNFAAGVFAAVAVVCALP